MKQAFPYFILWLLFVSAHLSGMSQSKDNNRAGLIHSLSTQLEAESRESLTQMVIENISQETIARADQMMKEKPLTVTGSWCKSSAGGKHDFYSEGDYWWPDPSNPQGPYIQRDGQTNPENFVDHRLAMIRLSEFTFQPGCHVQPGPDSFLQG